MDNDIVPPSSPPLHATTMNLPSSPIVAPQHRLLSPKSSSPPPLFSSDDSRESDDVGNYESPRIFKNKRKGAWWDSADTSLGTRRSKKTKMARNFDSGVYMLSDASDGSELSLPPHKPPFADLDLALVEDRTHLASHKREQVRALLDSGLEENRTNYFLDNLELGDSDIQDIGLLATVIKENPDPGNEQPHEAQYRSMTPNLYISLRNNRLNRLTPSLFNLSSLTTLVLVNNNIEELPPQIAQLDSLRELNLSQNPIRWLPFEFLNLFHPDHPFETLGDSGELWLQAESDHAFARWASTYSRRLLDTDRAAHSSLISEEKKIDFAFDVGENSLHDSHNYSWRTVLALLTATEQGDRLSFVQGTDDPTTPIFAHHPPFSSKSTNNPRFFAWSPVAYFDHLGRLIQGSPKIPSSDEDSTCPTVLKTCQGIHSTTDKWFTPPSSNKTQPLFSMALHTALHHRQRENLTIDDLRDWMGEDVSPQIERGLRQAQHNAQGGFEDFRKCHVCRAEYVTKRAEWIEWWTCPKQRTPYPVMLRACSWGCVPEEMRIAPEKRLDLSAFGTW